ncbi:hypothetical protein [Deinococcus sp. UYEF24]
MKRVLSLFVTAWLFVEAFAKFFLVLLLVGLGGMALAQGTAPAASSFDFASWGKSAAGFGLFVAAAVAILKGRFPKLAGYWVLLVSFAVAEVGAFLLFTTGLLTDPAYARLTPPWMWLAFGFGAFVTASGGYAALLQFTTARAAIKQQAVVSAAPMIGNHLILPAGTPGTEPLIHNGVQIGAVLPLTPGQPVQVATAPLR